MTDPRQVTAEGVAAVNAHDEARIRAVYADGAVLEAPGPVRIEGGDAATEYVMVWLRAFPELLRLDAGGLERAAVALHLLLHEGR